MTESAIQYAYVYFVNRHEEIIYAETRTEADAFFAAKFGVTPAERQFIERRSAP